MFIELLLGTVIYRPYVYGFFLCFLFFSIWQIGLKKTFLFILSTYLIAFLCEYSSTRNGFPFGPYTYFDDTRSRELWISNVPFWDSLSFVFLSYFSMVMSALLLNIRLNAYHVFRWHLVPVLGGVIMMLLDVVIDPVALQGEKWFLGKIYNYPYQGFYFGVTLANFLGWFFVGFITQFLFLWFLKLTNQSLKKINHESFFHKGILSVYAGIFFFNLAITIYIKDFILAAASFCVCSVTLYLMFQRAKNLNWKVLSG